MSDGTVQYESEAVGADLFEKYSEDHCKALALEQAADNASDPDHVAKVNDIIGRVRRGERAPVDMEQLRDALCS